MKKLAVLLLISALLFSACAQQNNTSSINQAATSSNENSSHYIKAEVILLPSDTTDLDESSETNSVEEEHDHNHGQGTESSPAVSSSPANSSTQSQSTHTGTSSTPVTTPEPEPEPEPEKEGPTFSPSSGNYASIYPENLYYKPISKDRCTRYHELTSEQQRIYTLLDKAAYDMQTDPVPLGVCEMDDIYIAYYSVLSDRPEYFWISTKYGIERSDGNYYFKFSGDGYGFIYTMAERKKMEAEMTKVLAEFNDYLGSKDLTAYEREHLAHDWLVARVNYCNEAVATSDFDTYRYAWTSYGALVKKHAVCEGYSKGLAVLLDMIGIENRIITGSTYESHMWNLVNVNDNWYHVDLTGDDANNGNYHTYFNLSDEYIKLDHYIDIENADSFNYCLPSCEKNDKSYFSVEGLLINSPDEIDEIARMMAKLIRKGRTKIEIEFPANSPYICSNETLAMFDISAIAYRANEFMSDYKIYGITLSGVAGSKSCCFEVTLG